MAVNIKRCPKCRTNKPLCEFYVHRQWKTGKASLQSWCKECKRAANKERLRAIRAPGDRSNIRAWRPPWGEKSHKAKLTADDVRLIRLLKGSLPARLVAPKFDIKPRTVYAVWRGEYWEHVG